MRVLADITVPAEAGSLDGLKASVIGSARELGFGPEGLFALEFVAEEAAVNIFNYAYPRGEGNIRLRCMDDGDRFVIEVTDWGVPFDVTAIPEPDVECYLYILNADLRNSNDILSLYVGCS